MGALLSLCTVGQVSSVYESSDFIIIAHNYFKRFIKLACCCGQAACSLFACCPSCGNSTSTKIMYGLMLLVAVILSCITLAPGLQSFLQKVCNVFFYNFFQSPNHSVCQPLYYSISRFHFVKAIRARVLLGNLSITYPAFQSIAKMLLATWPCIEFALLCSYFLHSCRSL